MVRVRGFEPPTSAFQVRSSGLSELHPVELAFPTGIEPACLPVRSRALVQLSYGKNESAFTRVLQTMWCDVWDSNPCCCAENADAWPLAERRMIGSGRRIRTCRILINSQAHPPRTVDRNELVDRLGVEPSASCLQGISPPRRPAQRKRVHARLLENGARTWFRATLSCSSGRRFHQISFPSVRPARIELASSEWHSEALPIDQGRMVGNRGIEPRVPKAQVLQTRSVTRLGITRIWLQGSELNRLCLSASAYEADQRPVLVPASRVRGLNSIACRQYIRGQQNLADSRGLDPQCLAASIPLRTGARHSPR
jgi:hypothetical protein